MISLWSIHASHMHHTPISSILRLGSWPHWHDSTAPGLQSWIHHQCHRVEIVSMFLCLAAPELMGAGRSWPVVTQFQGGIIKMLLPSCWQVNNHVHSHWLIIDFFFLCWLWEGNLETVSSQTSPVGFWFKNVHYSFGRIWKGSLLQVVSRLSSCVAWTTVCSCVWVWFRCSINHSLWSL